MITGTTAFGRSARPSGASVFMSVFLRFIFLLAAALIIAAAAAGEASSPAWEERLAEARAKYNPDTVNVYSIEHGKFIRGKINVYFYYSKDDRTSMNICIWESLQITDEAEMEAVLEVLAKDRSYSVEEYGTISFMKAQWITHNLAHRMATGSERQQMLIEAVAGESLPEIISSAKELDLSPLSKISDEQMAVYEFIESLYAMRRK